MTQEPHPCRLYLISPATIDITEFPSVLEATLSAGDVAAFQLRLKEVDDATIIKATEALLPVCRDQGVAFILNDRVDLAAQLKVDGVHLGQGDMPLSEARKLLGAEFSIGISCHDSGHLAMEAGEAGADYVAFGAFHPTTSKSPEKLAMYGTPSLDLLQWWATYTVVPCVAIGGMTPENCAPMVAAGADFIAAINAVWTHPEGPRVAVRAFNKSIKKGTQSRPPL
jgi:thiamine-phosphate pyrophosphorylase